MKNEKNSMRLFLPIAAALLFAGLGTGTASAQYPNPYPSPGTEAPAQTVIVATTGNVIATYNGTNAGPSLQLSLFSPVNGFGLIFDNQTNVSKATLSIWEAFPSGLN